MRNCFIPQGPYQRIINIVQEWKILNIPRLRELYGEITINGLREKVRVLERHGFLESFSPKGKNKYIFPKGHRPDSAGYGEKNLDRMFRHDLITGQVLREFFKWSRCLYGEIFCQVENDRVNPDAEIILRGSEKSIRVALEIELSRKNHDRIRRKFMRYGGDSRFDRVFFITDKETIFRSYGNYLMGLGSEIQEEIVLIFDPKLSVKSFDYKNSLCFYMGKTARFSPLFLNKRAYLRSI